MVSGEVIWGIRCVAINPKTIFVFRLIVKVTIHSDSISSSGQTTTRPIIPPRLRILRIPRSIPQARVVHRTYIIVVLAPLRLRHILQVLGHGQISLVLDFVPCPYITQMALVPRVCSAPRVCSTVAGNECGCSGGITEAATCSAWVGHWDEAGEVFVAALAAVVVASGIVAV